MWRELWKLTAASRVRHSYGSEVPGLSRWVAALDPAELERIADAFGEHEFPAGSHIIREDDRGARVLAFFAITDGTVSLAAGGSVVRSCGPGDFLGEIGLLDSTRRTATVTAETDVRWLGPSAWAFRTLVDEHPERGAKLAEAAASRRDGDS